MSGARKRPAAGQARPGANNRHRNSNRRRPAQQDRPPPQDHHAEQATLGSICLAGGDGKAGDVLATVRRIIGGVDAIYSHELRTVYSALEALDSAGTPIDLVTVKDEVARRGELEAVGGEAGLLALCESVPSWASFEHYARIVARNHRHRELIRQAGQLADAAYAGDDDALADLLAAIGSTTTATTGAPGSPVLLRMDSVTPRPVRWVWPGRVPAGKLTNFIGDPGVGKSLVTMDVAARISTGTPWPDAPGVENAVGGVVILSAEDDPEDTLAPRLIAAGADLSRIVVLQAVRRGDGREATFSLADDLPALEAAIGQTPDCRMVVVDPLSAYMIGIDSHRNSDVRSLLAPLAALAARTGVAVLGVTHIRKSDGPAIHRAIGSIAFVAAARAAWAFGVDRDDPDRRIMAYVKNNLSRDVGGLAYRIDETPDGAPVVVWEPGTVSTTADELLGRAAEPGERSAVDEAVDFLRDELAAGPVGAKEIKARADAAGIAPRTLDRAKGRLGVKCGPDGFRGPWVWRLPDGQSAPDSAECANPIHGRTVGDSGAACGGDALPLDSSPDTLAAFRH